MPGMRERNSARKWEIDSSTGRKTVSAKKEFTMFLRVAARAALLVRRIVILQSWPCWSNALLSGGNSPRIDADATDERGLNP